MMNRLMSATVLLALSSFSFSALADGHKVVLCHNEKNSISVGAPGLDAHLGHGDRLGHCSDDGPTDPEDSQMMDAVVLMRCVAETGNGISVDSFSSSVEFADPPLPENVPGPDSNCAAVLAALQNEDFRLQSVTGGDAGTDYLLVGKVPAP